MCKWTVYISTLYSCDGHKDYPDGLDESNCYCFIKGQKIMDNNFCLRKCSATNGCTFSTLYTHDGSFGCYSFTDNKLTNSKTQFNNISKNMTYVYSCKNSSLNIFATLVDDLIFDCPYQDDESELLSVSLGDRVRCKEEGSYECYPGPSRCYTEDQKCVYNLTQDTQTLMYCRNGQHLHDCKSKDCLWMFKCAETYCIPYRYLCDGKWDCWTGEDESFCRKYSCIVMFRCKFASVCIHTKNVCDGIVDCPMNDDEMICDKISCFGQCTCLNYGISCQQQNLIDEQNLFSILSILFSLKFQKVNYQEVRYIK